jgi:hypothetical protein
VTTFIVSCPCPCGHRFPVDSETMRAAPRDFELNRIANIVREETGAPLSMRYRVAERVLASDLQPQDAA